MRVLTAALLLAVGCTSFEVGELEIVSSTRNPGIAIPDDDELGVVDFTQIDRNCIVQTVEVDIEIRHTFRGDVFADLTSPSDTLLILKDLDDDDSNDVVGTFPTTLTPLQPLDAFAREQGGGGWALTVGDVGEGDVGTLVSWTLRLGCL